MIVTPSSVSAPSESNAMAPPRAAEPPENVVSVNVIDAPDVAERLPPYPLATLSTKRPPVTVTVASSSAAIPQPLAQVVSENTTSRASSAPPDTTIPHSTNAIPSTPMRVPGSTERHVPPARIEASPDAT